MQVSDYVAITLVLEAIGYAVVMNRVDFGLKRDGTQNHPGIANLPVGAFLCFTWLVFAASSLLLPGPYVDGVFNSLTVYNSTYANSVVATGPISFSPYGNIINANIISFDAAALNTFQWSDGVQYQNTNSTMWIIYEEATTDQTFNVQETLTSVLSQSNVLTSNQVSGGETTVIVPYGYYFEPYYTSATFNNILLK